MTYSLKLTSRNMISPLALMAGLVSYQTAFAQEAVVIENGQTETETVVLDEDGDSLTIEAGGALDVVIRDGVISTGNDVVITNDGSILANGAIDDVAAIRSRGSNGINTNTGSILTDGQGIDSSGAGAANTNSGSIRTNGVDARGILSSGVDAINTNSGTISTVQTGSVAIFSEGENATNTNSGVITTEGFESDGIVSTEVGALNINAGTINTTGEDSDGIDTFADDATNINSGTFTSTAFQSGGISSRGDNVVNTNSGSITTQGGEADGILSVGANATNTNSGSIQTAGLDSDGILSFSANTINSNSGRIVTTGDNASGIEARGRDSNNFNRGTITTSGAESHGVEMLGTNSTLTNTGLISATGEDSFAVLGSTGAQTVTLGEGSVIIGVFDLGGGGLTDLLGNRDTVNFENSGAGVSAVLTLEGVEILNINGDDRPLFLLDGPVENDFGRSEVIAVVDPTGFSVLGDATGLLANTAQRTVQQQATSGSWASVFGASRSRDDDGATLAYDTGLAGVMAGYETDLGANRLGFVGGVSAGETSTDIDATKITTESVFAGAYLGTSLGAFDVTTSLLAGVERHDSDRVVADNLAGFETANAQIDGSFVSAGLQVSGGGFTLGGVQLQPSASANYTFAAYDGYTEDGTTNANLEVDSRTVQSLNARAQLETVSVIGGLETAFRFGIDGRASDAEDVTIALDGQSQSFAETDSDAVLGGFLGARAVFSETDALRLTGDVEYGFADGGEDTVSAGLNVSFTF